MKSTLATLFILIFFVNPYILPSKGLLTEKNLEETPPDPAKRTQRTVVQLNKEKLWTGGVIPYEFTYATEKSYRTFVKRAMRHWEKFTCVQFVQRNEKLPQHQNYLLFTKTDICECCYYDQGSKIDHKIINLSDECLYKDVILHELGHAIGFFHEHNHPDRDNYVTVNYSRIAEDDIKNFMKYLNDEVDTLNLPYDIHSVMHYAPFFYFDKRKNRISPVIPPPQSPKDILGIGFVNFNNKLSYGDIAAAKLMYRCAQCGKTFFEPSGKFGQTSTGSENDPERCEWRIRAPEGARIVLKITSLIIHPSYLCLLDYLEIRNGQTPDSPVLARHCGEINDTKVIASNHLVVTYVKMSLFAISSFTAEYEMTCDQIVDIYNDTFYNFESPNYPNSYLPNQKCRWEFLASEGHQIAIKFDFFYLQYSQNCTNDFVRITEANEIRSTVIGVYCGGISPLYVYSKYRNLTVEFSSDESFHGLGFSGIVSSIVNTRNES